MEFYSTEVGGLSLKVRKTAAGWEASIAGPASLMTLETAQRAAENMASAMLGREVSNITWGNRMTGTALGLARNP